MQLHRKVGLLRVGRSNADIARELGISPTVVSLVLRDRCRSRRVELAIARALGEPVADVFPPHAQRSGRGAP